MTQTNIFDEIIVDNFAGGGGEPTEEQKHFARWVNCKQLFKSCSWAEYDRRR